MTSPKISHSSLFPAPITEEIVFRACVIAVYHMSGASTKRMIFLGPLSFGLAHAHHAWDTFNRYGRTASAAKRAIFMSLFQLSYTTLFGFHSSYLFVRTGSIYPPISAHIFCNIMGVPELMWELRTYAHRKTGQSSPTICVVFAPRVWAY
ncbi:hypothetical protein D9615_008876 [Tricholomella constricta]|uniref:intramembrane prenyl-peptidase Rce1 n=1 Tax=Tricholomella constricta TaxID=117010 RepID=A0A8H5H023_9AGAR|nr:hypothetical protein D9615_008876 [Tricholomella constricta]